MRERAIGMDTPRLCRLRVLGVIWSGVEPNWTFVSAAIEMMTSVGVISPASVEITWMAKAMFGRAGNRQAR